MISYLLLVTYYQSRLDAYFKADMDWEMSVLFVNYEM